MILTSLSIASYIGSMIALATGSMPWFVWLMCIATFALAFALIQGPRK